MLTAPIMTVQRTPQRSASQPMPMPPKPAPNQASAEASDGTDRTPPTSAAIGLSATTAIHIAPNDTPRITSDRLAVIQEVRVSMEGVIPEGRSCFPLLPAKAGTQLSALDAHLRGHERS